MEVCSHAVDEANNIVGVDLEYLDVPEEIAALFRRIVDGGEFAAENWRLSSLGDILEDFYIQMLICLTKSKSVGFFAPRPRFLLTSRLLSTSRGPFAHVVGTNNNTPLFLLTSSSLSRAWRSFVESVTTCTPLFLDTSGNIDIDGDTIEEPLDTEASNLGRHVHQSQACHAVGWLARKILGRGDVSRFVLEKRDLCVNTTENKRVNFSMSVDQQRLPR